jgi:hypothetical protein
MSAAHAVLMVGNESTDAAEEPALCFAILQAADPNAGVEEDVDSG